MEKIAIYIDTLLRNGAQRVTVNLANYLVQNGYECTIITGTKSEKEFSIPDNVTRINMNFASKKYAKYFINIIKFKRYLSREKFDIIIGMDLSSSMYVIPAAKNLKVKTIISERNDPTHFPGKKIVAIISQQLMKYADGFIFQTEDAKKFYNKITKGRGEVIANPLFTNTLPKVYNGKRNNIIVSAGRLTEQKNFDLLIDAFKIVHIKKPNYKLVIYGDGELREHLEKKIKLIGLEKYISLPGNISNILEKIKNNKLFVLSSNYEGMPNILIESLAIGLPCISTDCPIGGPKALIKNGQNGFLTKVNDVDELAEKMLLVLENENLAKNISKEGTKIIQKLDSNKICAEWVQYIKNIKKL